MTDDLDLAVRRAVYDGFLTDGRAMLISEIAGFLGKDPSAIRAALLRLAESHTLVLQPSSGEVLMASPFSAVPTAFVVTSQGRLWWGNCIWDGLGILAMTGLEGSVSTGCPDCGEALRLEVRDGQVSGSESVAHFAVRAREWWRDIVFT